MTATLRPRRFHSPCRSGNGPHAHRCSPAHAELVEGYRLWRDWELERAETESIGYATELAEYWSTHEKPTFAAYLRGLRSTQES